MRPLAPDLLFPAGMCRNPSFFAGLVTPCVPALFLFAAALAAAPRASAQGLARTASIQAAGPAPSVAALPVATNAIGLVDVSQMLRGGMNDAEIILAMNGKQLVDPVDAAAEAGLRGLGASPGLMDHLRSRPLHVRGVSRIARQVALVPDEDRAPAVAGDAAPEPREQRVARLAKRIEKLDARLRRVRTHLGDSSPLWKSLASSVSTETREQILKKLDAELEGLRRELGLLEGR